MDATVIILAAGEGTRMKSNHAKVSHRILAKPMIRWIVDASLAAGAQRVVTVVGSHGDEVRALLEGIDGVECVEQAERLGTGHAVKVAHRGVRYFRGARGGAQRRPAAHRAQDHPQVCRHRGRGSRRGPLCSP